MTTHNNNEQPNKENSQELEQSSKKFENQINILIYETAKANGHKATLIDSFRNKLGIIKEKITENTLTGKEFSYNNFKMKLISESFEEMQSLILENKPKIFRAAYIEKLNKEKKQIKQNAIEGEKNLADASSILNESQEEKRQSELAHTRKTKSKGNNLSK